VTHVWVEGRPRVADRALVGLDTDDLADKARWWQGRIA